MIRIKYTGLPCPDCPKFKNDFNPDCRCEPFEKWARLVEKTFGGNDND